MADAAEKRSEGQPRRALALDALRGWAIVTMCLSGVVPWGTLPSWMYHAQMVQIAPGKLQHDGTHAGYTWVDLVFPLFLFAMGAALPLALSSRLAKGGAPWKLALAGVWRGVLLAAFAIYAQHIAPWQMAKEPGTSTWILSMLGFALLFPIYMRLPDTWPSWAQWGTRAAGLGGAALLLSQITYPDGTGFRVTRSDIILLILANVAAAGTVLYVFTRSNPLLRLGALGILAAAVRARAVDGSWVDVLTHSPAPWLYNFDFMRYLFVVIPGTFAGEAILRWQGESPAPRSGAKPTALLLSFGCVLLVVFLHVALHARWTTAAPLVTIPVLVLLWKLFAHAQATASERLLRSLYAWGAFWLLLGLVFEPTEGGIKKDPATMSYYFVSTGMSSLLLLALTVWIDFFGRVRPFWLLIANGQNPMLAYVGIRSLLAPAVNLFGTENWVFTQVTSPWGRFFLWSVPKTVALAVVTALFTRWRVIWRT